MNKKKCQAEDSSKKRTNEFVFTSIQRVFVRFFEKSSARKKRFEIIWPLVQSTKNDLFCVKAPVWYFECDPNCKTRPQSKKISITNIRHSNPVQWPMQRLLYKKSLAYGTVFYNCFDCLNHLELIHKLKFTVTWDK